MPRLLFTCAYNGGDWRGWQSQAGGNTIQDVLEGAFGAILKSPLRIAASGRTDAGVHALAQCFHADIPESCRMSPENWRAALNAHLPGSIRILRVERVADDFHARFNACGKIYEYLISTAPVLSPFDDGRMWHRPMGVDVEALRAAMAVYVGTHDFRRFAARRGNEPEPAPEDYYRRTIYAADVSSEQGGEVLRLRFHGNGFMYRMVRMLVGTAYQVAAGKMSREELRRMLIEFHGAKTRHCAPPQGLFLTHVFYD